MRASAIYEIINRKQLNVVFQPIINLTKPGICGYEALVRGPEDTRLHSPKELFQEANDYSMLGPLEYLCIEIACQQFREQKLNGKLFLNISPMSLISGHTERHVVDLLREYKLDKQRVVIELSEQYPFEDYNIINDAVSYLRKNGYEIAIDDLGAGYSSLRLWSEFRPEYVKIDRHFIAGIDTDPVKHEFVRSIQEISKSLGCKVIAEGIETNSELQSLCALGISHGQGYLLGRPEPEPVKQLSKYLYELIIPFKQINYHRYRDTIADLLEKCQPLQISDTVESAVGLMQSLPLINSIPVLNGDKPAGVITRKTIFEIFLGRYGRELHSKKPVLDFITKDILIVEKDSELSIVSQNFTSSKQIDMNIDIIITYQGNYIGVVKTKKLLKKITEQQIVSARHCNPLTLLPGNIPIYEWIDDLLNKQQKFKFAYFDLNSFKPYNDIYGYSKGDEIIVLMSNVLKMNVDNKLDRVGHIGGDDFVIFFQSHDWEERCNNILDTFDEKIRHFYNETDIKNEGIYCKDRSGIQQFYPILSISIGVVEPDWRYCESHHDVASLAADAKHEAKKYGGNNLFFSRRRRPFQPSEELHNYGT